jgi:apolipoprotein N-acyltransferase
MNTLDEAISVERKTPIARNFSPDTSRTEALKEPLALAPLLIAGGALMAVMSMRFSIPALAWIAAAPLLAAMQYEGGLRRSLWVFAAIAVATHIAIAKIVTVPITWPMMLMFAIPISITSFAIVAVASAASRRLGPTWGIYAFPALVVTSEWLTYTATELSSWGAMAYTQVDNLALIQTASLAGIAGVSFLVAMGSSVTAVVLTQGWRPVKWQLALFAALFVAAHLYGEIRLANDNTGPSVRVAAVESPIPVERIPAIIANPSLGRDYDTHLFGRTALSADMGAKVAAWNEVATLVSPADEAAFVERGRNLAREKHIAIVMAYGVKRSLKPLRFENKYLWITPDGAIADEYFKRHPVPGEGSISGSVPARVVDTAYGKMSGGICYDYDFPRIALDNARGGAGVVFAPSSDWRGIDPLHSSMARFNAVAAGVSMVRSVRAATSFASDPYGRIRATMRFGEPGDGVMLATVPVNKVETLYTRTGDVLPLITAAFSALTMALLFRRRKEA